MTEMEAYHELSAYTLGHGNVAFIHQHVVDAWGAQHATADGKPIRLAFSLVGLFLKIEHGFSGRQVQKAHMQLAQRKQPWPPFVMPADRGKITTVDVMARPAGLERDRAIDEWCESVWSAFSMNRSMVEELLRQNRVV